MVAEVDDWVENLTECVRCLHSSDRESHQVKVLNLYLRLNAKIIDKRLRGENIRGVFFSESRKEEKDVMDDMVTAIKAHDEYSLGSLDDYFKEVGVELTVALARVIGARLDDNYNSMGNIIEWCNSSFPKGYAVKDFIMLRTAEYYYSFGKYRHNHIAKVRDLNSPKLPTTRELDRLLEDAQTESDDYHYRVQLFLVEAVAQLPFYPGNELEGPENELEEADYSDWLISEREKNPKNFEQARFSYILSRVEYVKGHLDESINLTIDALQKAVPNDVDFIDRCRARLALLEQEKFATETTVASGVYLIWLGLIVLVGLWR